MSSGSMEMMRPVALLAPTASSSASPSSAPNTRADCSPSTQRPSASRYTAAPESSSLPVRIFDIFSTVQSYPIAAHPTSASSAHPSSDPASPAHFRHSNLSTGEICPSGHSSIPQGEKGRRTQALAKEPPSPLEGEGMGVRGALSWPNDRTQSTGVIPPRLEKSHPVADMAGNKRPPIGERAMMSDDNTTPEPADEINQASETETVESASEPALDDRIALLEAEKDQLRDQLLRTAAEMDNLRKRTEREVADTRAYAITGFARDMLVATDNLSRALSVMPAEVRENADGALKSLIEGIEMTEREMQRLLQK